MESMSNWQQGSNPCGPQPWSGLVCDEGWVVAIRLQEKALLGQLTPDLLQVSRLAELHLANNYLTGKAASSSCWVSMHARWAHAWAYATVQRPAQ
jgi:hypothetical protein